jgi:aspartyl-tRNA synthetase
MADLDRVFEVAPVFRSENSLTHRHMTEFTGLDLEMTFHEHYHEVLDILDRTFNAIFAGLNSHQKIEMEAVRVQHPFRDLRYKYPCLRLRYSEAMALLRAKGPARLEEKLNGEKEEAARARLQERIAARGPDSVAEHGETTDMGTEVCHAPISVLIFIPQFKTAHAASSAQFS